MHVSCILFTVIVLNYRYGLRVNPLEWIIVLTGYNEGDRSQYPSVILIVCEYFQRSSSVERFSKDKSVFTYGFSSGK